MIYTHSPHYKNGVSILINTYKLKLILTTNGSAYALLVCFFTFNSRRPFFAVQSVSKVLMDVYYFVNDKQ